MNNIPTGEVTFLFTDIENSTLLGQEHNDNYTSAVARHQNILIELVESNNGFVFKNIGDSLCCSFGNPGDAVRAAAEAQIKLRSEEWKEVVIKVRMGLHSGNAIWISNDYSGYLTLARTQRIMSSACGEQILVSNVVMKNVKDDILEKVSFRDLGERRLKDLKEPINLYQIVSPDLRLDFPPISTLDARPNNLPVLLTNFIGREKEMSEIRKLLLKSRLITLMGPGGTGKTRLAIQTGADMIDEFTNGVWLTELAPVFDPLLITQTIAKTLGIREQPGEETEITLLNYLKDKELLIILDNCEHLIESCADIVCKLLQKCPGIKIIVTSREALKCDGEINYKVLSLNHPEPKQKNTPEELSQYDAVKLFIERAVSINPYFTVNNENAAALAQICFQLDGIPLAIELAAVRIKVLSLEEISKRLENRFRLLTGGNRNALPRQQTLKALIDWSFDLLSEDEKILFQRLSVFTGGWSLDAAQKICSDEKIDEYQILDLITNLIDKSIVNTKDNDVNTRFYMLETIRQYSCEKLVSKDEIFEKHFKYFLNFSKDDSKKNLNKSHDLWKMGMESDQDNLRTAIKWSMEKYPVQSAELVSKVATYWEITGNYSESYEALKKVLNMNVELDEGFKATMLLNTAFLACQIAEYEFAENYLNQGMDYFRRTGNSVKIAEGLSISGIISITKGESDKAIKYLEESLINLKDQNQKVLEANIKSNLAVCHGSMGNTEYSLKLLDEAIMIYKNTNELDAYGKSIISKGGLYFQSGDLENARICFEEGLPIIEKLNDQFSIATTLYNMGNLNFALKNYSEGVKYYESAMSKAREYGYTGIYDRSYIKLGETALMQNEKEKAKEIFISSLKGFNKDSEKLKLLLCILGLGKYYFLEENFEKSAKLFLLAERIDEIIKFRFSKLRLEENKSILDEIKNKLLESKFNSIFNEVRTWSTDNAVELTLGITNQ